MGAFYLVRTPALEFPAFKKGILDLETDAFAIDLTKFGTPVAAMLRPTRSRTIKRAPSIFGYLRTPT